MIIAPESPFRRLRTDLVSQQASFLDGIRLSAEMLDLAYTRLSDALWQASITNALPVPVAALFLDAWAMIDSVHRLRDLLDQMPGLKKSGPVFQLFQRKTQSASDFRNTIQHLRNELIDMSEHGWPAWGTLSWIAVLDAKSLLVASWLIVPGRVQSQSTEILNPSGKALTRQIDHLTLGCKSDRVSLTELYGQVERVIKAMEPSLIEHIADQSTLPADLVVNMQCRLEAELPVTSQA